MSELKLPTISPNIPHKMVNASSDDWRSWGNVFISAVSVETNAHAGHVCANLPTIDPGIRHAAANAAGYRLQ
jgi:peptide methionine sulfoxide reductase MsrB